MLEKILKSSKYVVDNSKYVKINSEKLNEFSKTIKEVNLKHWLSSSPFGLLELSTEDIINFLLIYESIDFSFWGDPKWTIDVDGQKEDGSIALLYKLLDYYKNNKNLDFSNISEKEFSNILKVI